MATQIALGEKFYLFKHDNKDTINPAEDHLLVTAHGGYMDVRGPLGSKNFKVPSWTQLHFYGAHGLSLLDPGVYDIMKGEYQVSETAGPGDSVTNYELSKYQGRHGNINETYTSISANIQTNLNRLDVNSRNFAFIFDVLTVRNRILRSDPSLKDMLNELDSHGYRYENIHCIFCRSPMVADSGSTSAKRFGS